MKFFAIRTIDEKKWDVSMCFADNRKQAEDTLRSSSQQIVLSEWQAKQIAKGLLDLMLEWD